MNIEAALITKVIKERDVTRAISDKVSQCFLFYKDVWGFVQEYYFKYKSVPTLEIVKKRFPDFEESDVDASLDFLIDEVSREYLRYKLGELITNSAEMVDENPREALEYIFAKASALGHQTDVVKDVDLASDYWMRVNSLRERAQVVSDSREKVLGVPSGIPQLDLLFGGWQKGDFVVLMGWTGAGKSTLATYLAVNAWRLGYKPLYFSLEMDDVQLGYRVDTILGEGAFSNTALINARNVDPDTYEAWVKSTFPGRQPFYVVTNEGLDEINQFTVQTKIEQYNPDLVILDYHSLFDDAKKGKTETEKHRNLSKDFKRLAVRYSIPIIDIVAVTMEDGHEQRPPELNEVAWSRQLAYDADLVLSLFRSGQLVTVEAKKSRRSELFAFKITWDFDSGHIVIHDW